MAVLPTTEYINGRPVTINAAFRQYANPNQSTQDWWALMNQPRYQKVITAQDFPTAANAVAKAGYATDPKYAQKLMGISASTPEQQAFLEDRRNEALQAGAPPQLAELAARQAALESGWGRSAPGGNYFGIKGRPDARSGTYEERAMARIPGSGPLMASTDVGPGVDAQAGTDLYGIAPQGAAVSAPQEASMLPTDPGLYGYNEQNPAPTPEYPGFGNSLMADPFFNIGLGILSAPGFGGNWLKGAAVGVQQGIASHQARQKFELELEATRGKLDEKKQRERLASIYEGRGDLLKAGAIRAGASLDDLMGAPGSPFSKVNPADFTPDSVSLFAKTGRYEDLRAVPKAPLVQIGGSGQQAPGQPVFGAVQPGYQRVINPETGLPRDKPIPGSAASEPTQGERTAASFFSRMAAAEPVIQQTMKGAVGGLIDQAQFEVGTAIPGVGSVLLSDAQQQYRAAQEDWVRAKLRKESGAAIPPDEMDREISTYFPRFGETDDKVIAQKAAQRRLAAEALYNEAGKAPVAPESAAERRAMKRPEEAAGSTSPLSPAEQQELEELENRYGK